MRKNIAHVSYHIGIVSISAALALSLPSAIKFISERVLASWALIENEGLCHTAMEIASAVVLIVIINSIVKDWKIRRRSRMAADAGLVAVAPPASFLAGRWLKRLKQEQGLGRNVMLIGSTGYRTFADPSGYLNQVVRNCREARIMLLDPLGDGVSARAKSLADPEITPETLREQLMKSIEFLKELKRLQKNVRLKLYSDVPLVKLCILGDYLCLQHYPSGLNVRKMPEFVFKHGKDGNLFSLFYQYFASRWFDPAIPEYDLDTDELVYRNRAGNEVKREKFDKFQPCWNLQPEAVYAQRFLQG